MIAAYRILNLCDLALTIIILELGGIERNPFLNQYLVTGGLPLMALVKIVSDLGCAAAMSLFKYLLPSRHRGLALLVSMPMAVHIALVCAWNVGVIFRLVTS